MGLRNTFTEVFEGLGGEIVSEESHESTTKDMKTQLSKIKESNPDIIYFVAYPDAAIVGLKQAKELGINTQILGGDAFDANNIWEEVGSAGEGAIWVVPDTPLPEDFVNKMKSRGSDAVLATQHSYDAVKLLSRQIALVGNDATSVKDSFYVMSPYNGVSGVIDFDMNGDIKSATYKIKTYKGGQMVDM